MKNPAELFVFETHGCVECKKCRRNFLPRPGFPQNSCSTDFSRLIKVILCTNFSSRKISTIQFLIFVEITMKQVLLLALLLASTFSYAADKKNEWHSTTLSEKTIKTIQQAQYDYKKCVMTEMQKKGYLKIESRSATEAIIKQCENVLSNIRQVYLKADVPAVIADRHLKKMRITITRRVLKQLMFAEAANRAGAVAK